jgi:hypothetical protein
VTLLAPGFLYASMAIAAGIVALHFLVMRQPRSSILPTARFVPDARTTTISPANRPRDPSVLLLRVLTALLVGAALARPIFQPSRRAAGRVILVDASRSARDSLALRDSSRSVYRDGDAIVLFDSSARVLGGQIEDSLRGIKPSIARGNLSAAFVAALRAGSGIRNRFDSLDLVIVSPFAKEEFDAATDSIRALWPGRARLIRLTSPSLDSTTTRARLQMVGDPNDPLATTVSLTGNTSSDAVIFRNSEPLAASVVAPGGPSAARRMIWPSAARPPRAFARAKADTIGGVVAGDVVVVAPFERRWIYPADSIRGDEVVARWMDGEPAAIELSNGSGCNRSVAIPVTPVGDLAIRKEFIALVAELARPCSAQSALVAADPSAITRLAGKGGSAPREDFQPLTDTHSPVAPWLLALAIALAIAELLVRRRASASQPLAAKRRSSREARAA